MISDRLLWSEAASPWIQGLGLFGIVDISSIDQSVAARPSAQLGGSVLGLENSAMYFLMEAYNIAEVFTFPHSSVTGREVELSREDLCPAEDSASDIIRGEQDVTDPITVEELAALASGAGMDASDVTHLVNLRTAGIL